MYRTVLVEMARNLAKQKDPIHLVNYHEYIEATPIVIVLNPPPTLVQEVSTYVAVKDAVIVASAISEHQKKPIDYFVTYDRKHILKPEVIEKSGLNIVVPEDAVKAITGE